MTDGSGLVVIVLACGNSTTRIGSTHLYSLVWYWMAMQLLVAMVSSSLLTGFHTELEAGVDYFGTNSWNRLLGLKYYDNNRNLLIGPNIITHIS